MQDVEATPSNSDESLHPALRADDPASSSETRPAAEIHGARVGSAFAATLIDPGAQAEMPSGTLVGGRYTLLHRTRRCELGAIYEAVRDDGQPCAVRIVERVGADDAVARLLHEGHALARLQSAYTPTLYGCGEDDTCAVAWVATESLPGATLAERLTAVGAGNVLGDDEAWGILDRVAEAIADLHRAGVVHCDLKPANVLLCDNAPSGVKLIDFSSSLTPDGRAHAQSPAGTPLWMAPEQARGGTLSPATDVWAFGLLAFRVVTGRNFWRVAQSPIVNVRTFLEELLAEQYPPASEQAKALGCVRMPPQGFDAWFAHCVVADMYQRFHDADELRFALREVKRPGLRVRTLPPPMRAKTPPSLAPRPRDAWGGDGADPDLTTRMPSLLPDGTPRKGTPRDVERADTPTQTPSLPASPFQVSPFAPPGSSPWHAAREATPSSPAVATTPLDTHGRPRTELRPWHVALAGALVAGGAYSAWRDRPHTTSTAARRSEPPRAQAASVSGLAARMIAPETVPTPPSAEAWPVGERRVWLGRSIGEDGAWTFTLTLRRASTAGVLGYFAWSGAAPGSQARESVTGQWRDDPSDLELHGEMSSAPGTRAVNAYRLRFRDDGGLSGTTADGRDVLEARTAPSAEAPSPPPPTRVGTAVPALPMHPPTRSLPPPPREPPHVAPPEPPHAAAPTQAAAGSAPAQPELPPVPFKP